MKQFEIACWQQKVWAVAIAGSKGGGGAGKITLDPILFLFKTWPKWQGRVPLHPSHPQKDSGGKCFRGEGRGAGEVWRSISEF